MTGGGNEHTLDLFQFRGPFQCLISRPQITNVVMAMRDEELDLLHNAELKEAFDEFDKVEIFTLTIV